jgi:hypothetical protein
MRISALQPPALFGAWLANKSLAFKIGHNRRLTARHGVALFLVRAAASDFAWREIWHGFIYQLDEIRDTVPGVLHFIPPNGLPGSERTDVQASN